MAEWLPIETAPKDRYIKLLVPIGDEEIEVTAWWVDIMQMWTSGGMSLFHGAGWQEPDLKDGLRLAQKAVMNIDCNSVEDLNLRNRIADIIHDLIKDIK